MATAAGNAMRATFGAVARRTHQAVASSSVSSARLASTQAAADAASTSTSAAPDAGKHVNAYFLLSRLPVVLPAPTPFESAFYAYNAKLQRSLAQPFPRELYFKKGSAAETQFLREEKEREEQWKRWGTEQADGETRGASMVSLQGDAEQIRPRKTKADETNDESSLDRSLDRTLFLVVRDAARGTWTLPRTEVQQSGSDSLHSAVTTSLTEQLGEDMDIWMLTNVPVGIIGKQAGDAQRGFVMRGHLTAGWPKPQKEGLQYAWLTQEEIEKRLEPPIWSDLKDLLSA